MHGDDDMTRTPVGRIKIKSSVGGSIAPTNRKPAPAPHPCADPTPPPRRYSPHELPHINAPGSTRPFTWPVPLEPDCHRAMAAVSSIRLTRVLMKMNPQKLMDGRPSVSPVVRDGTGAKTDTDDPGLPPRRRRVFASRLGAGYEARPPWS